MGKRYRVTQYEQMSELGLALFNSPQNRGKRLKVASKDYRWLWVAKIRAAWSRGESAGFGLRLFTTEIEDLEAPLPAIDTQAIADWHNEGLPSAEESAKL